MGTKYDHAIEELNFIRDGLYDRVMELCDKKNSENDEDVKKQIEFSIFNLNNVVNFVDDEIRNIKWRKACNA